MVAYRVTDGGPFEAYGQFGAMNRPKAREQFGKAERKNKKEQARSLS
jgi:hypothetical protein